MEKVLVVDDSPTSRAIVAKLLGADHRISAASSGQEALELLSREAFDVILLDLLMPGMDGRAVLAAIKALGLRPPVVVMTADIQEKTRSGLADLGVGAVVNKPLTREKLLGGMAAALKREGEGSA
ncbi:MAG: response regulator [Treponema sp.]|nr:response regulator [Treponema sp.]